MYIPNRYCQFLCSLSRCLLSQAIIPSAHPPRGIHTIHSAICCVSTLPNFESAGSRLARRLPAWKRLPSEEADVGKRNSLRLPQLIPKTLYHGPRNPSRTKWARTQVPPPGFLLAQHPFLLQVTGKSGPKPLLAWAAFGIRPSEGSPEAARRRGGLRARIGESSLEQGRRLGYTRL